MGWKWALLFTLTALLASSGAGRAQQGNDPRVADLVQSGKVRVGLFLPQYTKDASSGELKGVWAESARALAARIGVQLVLVEHPTPPQAIACLKAGACDLLFLPFDERSADVGDFSSPIFQFDYTLLVPGNSAIQRVVDADRSGTKIAAVRNHASTAELSRLLKQAELAHAETPDRTFELLRDGQASAMASARPTLLGYARRLTGSRVLEDRYGANINRIVVPKGKAAWLAYVSEFVETAKASGVVRTAIERGGPPGVTVSPPGDPK
ncbi:MAG: transporter substrate-binding domain-containing protein [Xanthobacteraceae bacterium]|nr:transporter substrate-binding domain-containing protein [Xanthobacteraceae bacterium]